MSARDELFRLAVRQDMVAEEGAAQLLDAYRAEVERDVRSQVAEDFKRVGKTPNTDISWGRAFYIARDGLCSCSGGLKPCEMAGESRG